MKQVIGTELHVTRYNMDLKYFFALILHIAIPYGTLYEVLEDVTNTNAGHNATSCHFHAKNLDCSNLELKTLPDDIPCNITGLDLSQNKIKSLENHCFASLTKLLHLDLSHNNLHSLKEDSFKGLTKLEYLNLNENPLAMNRKRMEEYFPKAVFSDLESLRVLMLDSSQSEIIESYPDDALSVLHNLETLVLPARDSTSQAHNFVDRTEGYKIETLLGEGFRSLYSLRKLVFSCNGRSIGTIQEDTFAALAGVKVRELSMRDCKIVRLHPKAFHHFKELKTLNMACNSLLGFDAMWQALGNMTSTVLDTLVVDDIQKYPMTFCSLPIPNNLQSLKRLSIRSDFIVNFEFDALQKFPSIRHLNVGYNAPLTVDNPFKIVQILNELEIQTFDWGYFGVIGGNGFSHTYCHPKNIDTETFFRKPPSFLPVPTERYPKHVVDYTQSLSGAIFKMNLPTSFNFLYLDHINSFRLSLSRKPIIFNDDNNILLLNISGHTWKSSMDQVFVGLNKCRVVDISLMRLEHIEDDVLSRIPSLTHLYLHNNSLTETFRHGKQFSSLSNLQHLDLSYNKIKEINVDLFHNLTNLRWIALKGNVLDDLDFIPPLSPNLTLDLSSQAIPWKGHDMERHLRNRTNITVNLSGNTFICNCSNIGFIHWFQKQNHVEFVHPSAYTCTLNHGIEEQLLSVDVETLEESCRLAIPYYVFVFFTTLAIIAPSLLYYYQWEIRWMYYKMRRRALKGEPMLLSGQRRHHAFVLYTDESNADYEWVADVLVPKVEEQWQLSLCVAQRDFPPGPYALENTATGIDSSHRTLILLSPAFLRCQWCDFCLNMALTKGQRSLIICIFGDVLPEEMSSVVRTLVQTRDCLLYTEDTTGKDLFWERLQDALTAPLEQ